MVRNHRGGLEIQQGCYLVSPPPNINLIKLGPIRIQFNSHLGLSSSIFPSDILPRRQNPIRNMDTVQDEELTIRGLV